MTRDELVERMAISAFWESPTRWGIPGGDFKNISERDKAAFRNMMYVALTELEKHAVVTARDDCCRCARSWMGVGGHEPGCPADARPR